VYDAAPRLDERFLRAISRLDDPSLPIAEVYRRTRKVAGELGLPRPSYERVRQHIHEVRRVKRRRKEKWDVLLDVAYQVRPVEALSELIEP
jgi:hypothetical protein